jgi:hypothetical protein
MKKLVLTLIFVAFSAVAYCCSCIGESTVEGEFQSSDVVLKGKVISKRIIDVSDTTMPGYTFHEAEYKFRVLTLYKGQVKQDTLTIITGLGGGDCGYPFEMGKEYVVYSFFDSYIYSRGNTTHGVLYTHICTRTTSAIDKAEIKALRKIVRKRKHAQ